MITPKKSLGQHFLQNPQTAERIAALAVPTADEKLLEIGPGTGVLTRPLLSLYPQTELFAVETDPRAVETLIPLAAENPLLHVVHADILKFSLPNGNFVAIGNLPYYISSSILFYFLDYFTQFRRGVFMLQLEVAKRIAANEGNKEYGILSVLLGRNYKRRVAFSVPPGAFFPPPLVKSAILTLERIENPQPLDEARFRLIVKAAFNQRRKMLSNSLKGLDLELPVEYESKRPEQLSIQDFEKLAIFTQLKDVGAK